jgi:hypothetical protein
VWQEVFAIFKEDRNQDNRGLVTFWPSADRLNVFSRRFIRSIVEKTVTVEIVTSKHQGQNALITKKDCDKSQKAKTNPQP